MFLIGDSTLLPIPTKPYYYVRSNYSGEGSLKKAKTIVPGAFVRNFPDGPAIQMGAYKKEAGANSLVEQLQQKGISASIYRP